MPIKLVGFLGFAAASYGLLSAFLIGNTRWYSFFVTGGFFFLAFVNETIKNKSFLDNLKKRKKGSWILSLLLRRWSHY